MPMLDFDALTKEQAEALLERTLADHEPALARLRERVSSHSLGTVGLDGAGALEVTMPEGLVPLWRWFIAWFDAGRPASPGAAAPAWYVPAEGDGMPLDVPTLAVVDEVGHFLAGTVLHVRPDARWHVARRAKRLNYAYQNMPAIDIGGTDLVPNWPVRALAIRLAAGLDEARDPDSLLAVHQRYVTV